MRLAVTLVILALAVGAPVAGCGSSGDSTSTVPHMGNGMPHMGGTSMAQMRAAWMGSAACRHPHGASRWGCSVGPYRCQAVVTDRGWSVDCAKPGRSIPFTVPPRK